MESENVTPEAESLRGILTMNVPTMIKGLAELGSLDITDFSLNLAISQVVAKLTPIERAYLKTAQGFVKAHIEVDERGIPKTQGEGPYKSYVYKSAKDKETYLSEMEKLNNTEVKIDLKIKTSQLKDVKGLKAITLMKLGVLIENDLEAVATE
jgi:hypothetical protein